MWFSRRLPQCHSGHPLGPKTLVKPVPWLPLRVMNTADQPTPERCGQPANCTPNGFGSSPGKLLPPRISQEFPSQWPRRTRSFTQAPLDMPISQDIVRRGPRTTPAIPIASLPGSRACPGHDQFQFAQLKPAGRRAGQVTVPCLDELLEVAGQDQSFDKATYESERSLELDPVHHCGPGRILPEFVHVPEPPKRSPNLLIDKIVG